MNRPLGSPRLAQEGGNAVLGTDICPRAPGFLRASTASSTAVALCPTLRGRAASSPAGLVPASGFGGGHEHHKAAAQRAADSDAHVSPTPASVLRWRH